VSRRAATRKSGSERLKTLPWVAVAQAGMVVARHWRALSAGDRARLAQLARKSGGRTGSLSRKERLELRKLVGRLDLKGMARELLPLTRRRRGRRRCSRACK
jgi:hypothetical protein